MRNIGRNLVVLVVLVGLVGFFGGCATTNAKIYHKQAEKLPSEIQLLSIVQSPLPKEINIQVSWASDIELVELSSDEADKTLAKMRKALVRQFTDYGWKIAPGSSLKLDVKITYFKKGSTLARSASSFTLGLFTFGKAVIGTTELRLHIFFTKDDEPILGGDVWMRTYKKGSFSALGELLEASTKYYSLYMIQMTLAHKIVQLIEHFGGFPPQDKKSKK